MKTRDYMFDISTRRVSSTNINTSTIVICHGDYALCVDIEGV